MAQTRCYQNGKLINENFPLDEVSEHLQKKGAVVWIDLTAPNRDELELLANEMNLHVLALKTHSKYGNAQNSISTPTTCSSPPITPRSRATRPTSLFEK